MSNENSIKSKITVRYDDSEFDLETGSIKMSTSEHVVYPEDEEITLQVGSSEVTITPSSIVGKVDEDESKINYNLDSGGILYSKAVNPKTEALQKQVDTLADSIANLTEEIERKANSVDVVEDLIALNEQVSQKADNEELNNVITDIQSLASHAESMRAELQDWKKVVSVFASDLVSRTDGESIVVEINNSPSDIRIKGGKIEVDVHTMAQDNLNQNKLFDLIRKLEGKRLR